MKINKVGIIGAGKMGTGIAEVCAVAGFAVHLIDLDDDILKQSVEAVADGIARRVDREKLSSGQRKEVLDRITTGTSYDGLRNVHLAIEAAFEDEEVKKAILKQVCEVLPAEAIITTNTSSISITRLAAQTDRPGRFMGTHFMNPVPKMELVELIRGIATDEDTYHTLQDFMVSIGKVPISAEDFPAFIVHRILLPMINEAVYTLYEGVGSVESIDTAMRLGTHHPMGPLELADFIGLDTCLRVMHTLHEGLADSKYRPCPLLVKYVEAGWLGRKTGRGFYDYSGDRPIPTR
jgi:3-hydroxybutyryl-CoA dehydrogenase